MPRKPHEKLPTNPIDLDGATKAAVLLLAVGNEKASIVLKSMPAEVVEEVTRELASLGRVPSKLQEAVVREFYDLTVANEFAGEGNLDFAKELLQNSLDPDQASKVLMQIQTQVQKTPFSFLQRAESENLLTFIQDEHPQTNRADLVPPDAQQGGGDPGGLAHAEADRGDQAHRQHGADQS